MTHPITPPPELVEEWANDSVPMNANAIGRDWERAFATRAALAQPEPQGPTDEELDEFAVFWWGSDTDERGVSDVIECGSITAFARAVLARWGRPAIEPVPHQEAE